MSNFFEKCDGCRFELGSYECTRCKIIDGVPCNFMPMNDVFKRYDETPDLISWDKYFLKISDVVSMKSKDQSSKIGAVIVGPGHEIRSTGYNGFPRGMNDDDPARQARPLKYKYFEHAERNAIYNAARFGASVEGCTMYCPWPPCSDCARAIIQAGIVKLVVNNGILACPDRWHEDMIIAAAMLRECGVKFELYND